MPDTPVDTIAAIATPPGAGGLAVIRISGPQAVAIAHRCFRPAGASNLSPLEAPSHTVHYGHIVCQGKTVDEVLLAIMRAPRTFTREDVVEISCHGGPLVARLTLDVVLACGARLAQPGEFTRRAFLSGRIDLAQAEAVIDLIHSRTELALAAAQEQLAGHLSQRINHLRDDLLGIQAHLEAHIDFPDEDIAPNTRAQLVQRLRSGQEFMSALLRTAEEGRILRHGLRTAIVGSPNAGKSSLLNQLLGHERAIVSPIPGTTRDTIEETANLRGLPVVLVDTAGLREVEDVIEAEGVKRSHAALAQAELILHVLDNSQPLSPMDAANLSCLAGRRRILIRNKCDLPAQLELPEDHGIPEVSTCCLTGLGIASLKDLIQSLVWAGKHPQEDLPAFINARHQDALSRAHTAATKALDALERDLTLELVAMELRIAVDAVGEIVGKTSTEDLLDSIFSQFCIGK